MLEGDSINFKELDRIEGKDYEKGSLRKQCERRAMIIRAKGLELPQPLYKNQSSALNYAITELPEDGKDITSGMLFKKIAYSKKT